MSVGRPKQRVIPIRFDETVAQEMERLADEETEGKLSVMARKLIREALAARQKAAEDATA